MSFPATFIILVYITLFGGLTYLNQVEKTQPVTTQKVCYGTISKFDTKVDIPDEPTDQTFGDMLNNSFSCPDSNNGYSSKDIEYSSKDSKGIIYIPPPDVLDRLYLPPIINPSSVTNVDP